MAQRISTQVSDLPRDRTVFWSTGDHPIQEVSGFSLGQILLHLKALYLLSDKIVGSASFFFESKITRQVTQRLRLLFERGEILYFVNSSIEDYTEHGARKIEKSPHGLVAYQDKKAVLAHARFLDSLGYILRRPSYVISDKIVDLWTVDVLSIDAGSLGSFLRIFLPTEQLRVPVEMRLIDIARNRGPEDFVWDYLQPRIVELGLPKGFIALAKRRLAHMYAIATTQLLGIPLDQVSSDLFSATVSSRSRYDSGLFLDCMDILGLTESLQGINDEDIVLLKQSSQFKWFRDFYFALIEAVDFIPVEMREWLVKYRDYAIAYTESGITTGSFLAGFRRLCRTLGKPSKQYSKPLEILLYTYDSLNKLTIEDFVRMLSVLREKPSGVFLSYPRERSSIKQRGGKAVTNELTPEDPRVVMVIHGRDKKLNSSMFEFLRAIGLDPKEWPQLVDSTAEGSPYIGDVLDNAFSIAQAVVAYLTPDDEAQLRPRLRRKNEPTYETELTPQPRPNVIFEAGMAFARKPKRTIIVTVGHLRPMSDIDGRHVVRLDNKAESRHELAQRLERAGCPVNTRGTEWLSAGDFRAK